MKIKLKKCFSACLCCAILLGSLPLFVSGQEETTHNKDPYEEFHAEIQNIIYSIYDNGNKKIDLASKQIKELRETSMTLFKTKTNEIKAQNEYTEIAEKIEDLESTIETYKSETNENIKKVLTEKGLIYCPEKFDTNENDQQVLKLQDTDPALLQIGSDVWYVPETKEFYYQVLYEYNGRNIVGGFTGINDYDWGDYDLLSVQQKDDNGWNWNNITVRGRYSNTVFAGEANKYGAITYGDWIKNRSEVSSRHDFWNGCIFNVRDETILDRDGVPECTIQELLVSGWLQTRGTSRSTQIKSEYEHNYRNWFHSQVQLGQTGLDEKTFSMSVSYVKQDKTWHRTSGARYIEIPEGC